MKKCLYFWFISIFFFNISFSNASYIIEKVDLTKDSEHNISLKKLIKKNKKNKRNKKKKKVTVPLTREVEDIANFIIDQTYKINNDQIFTNDFQSSSSPHTVKDNFTKAQVFLIGENHTDLDGQLKNAIFINEFIDRNSIVLIEGCDRKETKNGYYIEYEKHLLRHMIITKLYNEQYRTYFPTKREQLAKSIHNTINKALTRVSSNIASLKSFRTRAYCWDDDRLLGKSKINASKSESNKFLLGRNYSMIKEIKYQIEQGKKVFVIAGANHLPLGEFFSYRENPTTQIVQNYLKNYNIGYVQIFPNSTY